MIRPENRKLSLHVSEERSFHRQILGREGEDHGNRCEDHRRVREDRGKDGVQREAVSWHDGERVEHRA